MDEQVTPTESVTVTPDPVVVDTPVTEQLQAETPQSQAEPAPTSETAQIITPEPIPEILPETPMAQLAGSEPITPTSVITPTPETTKEAATPSAEAIAEAPQPETPIVTQGSNPTPEPALTPAPSPESMPAQAQVTVTPPRNIARLLLKKAKLTIQLRKQKKLVKIMNLFEKKKSITNDDVEKLLHVSDATATRYLSTLEKQGKIAQMGKTGRAVIYTKR